MVVDDDPNTQAIVENILLGSGYVVQCLSSGQELLNRLDKERPDLVILDIVMPGMDGLEVLQRIKGNPDTSFIPVILLTGKGRDEDILLGYQRGTDYYITKPFTGTQLIHGIQLILGNSGS